MNIKEENEIRFIEVGYTVGWDVSFQKSYVPDNLNH